MLVEYARCTQNSLPCTSEFSIASPTWFDPRDRFHSNGLFAISLGSMSQAAYAFVRSVLKQLFSRCFLLQLYKQTFAAMNVVG